MKEFIIGFCFVSFFATSIWIWDQSWIEQSFVGYLEVLFKFSLMCLVLIAFFYLIGSGLFFLLG